MRETKLQNPVYRLHCTWDTGPVQTSEKAPLERMRRGVDWRGITLSCTCEFSYGSHSFSLSLCLSFSHSLAPSTSLSLSPPPSLSRSMHPSISLSLHLPPSPFLLSSVSLSFSLSLPLSLSLSLSLRGGLACNLIVRV